MAHPCGDPNRATQCRAQTVAAKPAVSEMSNQCHATPLKSLCRTFPRLPLSRLHGLSLLMHEVASHAARPFGALHWPSKKHFAAPVNTPRNSSATSVSMSRIQGDPASQRLGVASFGGCHFCLFSSLRKVAAPPLGSGRTRDSSTRQFVPIGKTRSLQCSDRLWTGIIVVV